MTKPARPASPSPAATAARVRWPARLLPSPFLSAGLLLLWLLLNRSLGVGDWLLGALFAQLIPLLAARLRPATSRPRRPGLALRLLGVVFVDLWRTGLVVARGVLRRAPPRSGFIEVPLELRDPAGLALLAIIVCLTPDTLWAGLSPDRTRLRLHVFELDDAAAYAAEVKRRYEQPLLEIFQR